MSKPFRLTALEPNEHAIQDAILRYLALDPRVAWAERFNTGAHVIDDAATLKARLLDKFTPRLYAVHKQPSTLFAVLRQFFTDYYALKKSANSKRRFIRYAFVGCSDILGQTVDGRMLAIECKTRTKSPTPEQHDFLTNVNAAGGLGLVARSIEDVQHALNTAGIERPARTTAREAYA